MSYEGVYTRNGGGRCHTAPDGGRKASVAFRCLSNSRESNPLNRPGKAASSRQTRAALRGGQPSPCRFSRLAHPAYQIAKCRSDPHEQDPVGSKALSPRRESNSPHSALEARRHATRRLELVHVEGFEPPKPEGDWVTASGAATAQDTHGGPGPESNRVFPAPTAFQPSRRVVRKQARK